MLICRTPFRISFFGGGTDYPAWYEEHGGCVLSTTINKYSYITLRNLPPFFDYKFRIRYFDKEEVNSVDEIKHPSVRECCKYLNIDSGIEIVHNADLPARSGLGSSSTFTVGMLHSLHTLQSKMPTKRELAIQAIDVEQNLIKEAVGSQDQTSAAFGGFNQIVFNKDKTIEVNKMIIKQSRLKELEENLLLCFTGFARTASDIAIKQIEETPRKTKELNDMKEICDESINILANDNQPVSDFGRLLNDQWKIKRVMTNVTTSDLINDIYETGIANGAEGGKLLGAGGGGFMLFYADKAYHTKIKQSLNKKMFVPFRFENTGSKIIYHAYDQDDQ